VGVGHPLAAAGNKVVGEVVDQGKDDTVDSSNGQLRSARGQADEHTGSEGNEQNDNKGELEPLHCIVLYLPKKNV